MAMNNTTNLAALFALLLFVSRSPTTAGAGAPVAPHVPAAGAAASSDWFGNLNFALKADGGQAGRPIDSQTVNFLRSVEDPSMRAVITKFDAGLFFSRQGESSTMSHFFATFFEGIVYEGYPFDDAIGKQINQSLLEPVVDKCVELPSFECRSGGLAAYPRTEMAQAIFVKYVLGGPLKLSVKQLMLESYVGHSVDPPLTDLDLAELSRATLAHVYAAVARASSRGISGNERTIAAFDVPLWKYSIDPVRYLGGEVDDLIAIAFDHKQSRSSDVPAVDSDLIRFLKQYIPLGREIVGIVASKYRLRKIMEECASTVAAPGTCKLPAIITHAFDAAMFLRFIVAPSAGVREAEANYLLHMAGVTTKRPLLAEDLRTIAATSFEVILGHIRAAGEEARAPSPVAYAIDQIIH